MFISYAQNFEDVMLWRASKKVAFGSSAVPVIRPNIRNPSLAAAACGELRVRSYEDI
jgi:hypothetical protein